MMTDSSNGTQPHAFYMATVCLEPNRWKSKIPSFAVSDWLPRFAADGFDGLEIWERHFILADAAEQERLIQGAPPIRIYNSYVGFGDGDAEARAEAARAISRLKPLGVKYNLGAQRDALAEYRANLLDWERQLPLDCILQCECHGGTVMEKVEDAAAFFAPLDPARFGIIVHVAGTDVEGCARWFDTFGDRVKSLHVQMRTLDPLVAADRKQLDAGFEMVRRAGFRGTVTIEFSRGIGPNEQMAQIYANACVDLKYCREVLSC